MNFCKVSVNKRGKKKEEIEFFIILMEAKNYEVENLIFTCHKLHLFFLSFIQELI